MSAIQKVAVIGASGTVGTPVIASLIRSGFNVTAISRQESTAKFPAGVIVKRVDTNSIEALTEALKGQDAVVSAIATAATGSQKIFIDAAVAAHVRRFIPSEFGINIREARNTKIGRLLKPKLESLDYLIELSQKYDWFTWTGLSTGSFFDWSLRAGILGFNLKNKTADIFDSGNEPYSVTNLPFIGESVAAILKKPEKTANKYLTVASFTTTQRKVLEVLEKETGSKFKVTNVKTSDMEKLGDDKLARGDYSAFLDYAVQWLFADGSNHAVKHNDAQLLGLEEEDLTATIKKLLSEVK